RLFRRRSGRDRGEGLLDRERRSRIASGAFGPDAALVLFDQHLGNGQPEADPAEDVRTAAAGVVPLGERVEDPPELGLRHADDRIRNLNNQLHALLLPRRSYAATPADRRALHGVIELYPELLLHTVRLLPDLNNLPLPLRLPRRSYADTLADRR